MKSTQALAHSAVTKCRQIIDSNKVVQILYGDLETKDLTQAKKSRQNPLAKDEAEAVVGSCGDTRGLHNVAYEKHPRH